MRLKMLITGPVAGLAGLAGAIAPSTAVTFQIQATHLLPNSYALRPSTRATLSSLRRWQLAPLSTSNAFIFRNVTPGSYLVDIHCPTHVFAPLRLDVLLPERLDGHFQAAGTGFHVEAWETYRGNDWDNKGRAVPMQNGVFGIQTAGHKNYFMERSKFSVLGVLRNPVMLLGLVSMAIYLGMPYLVDSMDPEMRAEFEQRQKSNPMSSIMGSASGQSPGNFDMAAFLAGSKNRDDSGSSGIARSSKADTKKRK